MNVEIEIVFFFGFINFCFLFYFILCIYWMVIFRNARLLSLPWVAAVGCCSGGAAQSPICESSCNVRGNVRTGEVDDDRGMVSDVEEVLNLGGRDMLSRMRDYCLRGVGDVDGSGGSGVFTRGGGGLFRNGFFYSGK